jgi:ADP-ribose pyrophosphatase YjhB (NUDIX family)
VTFATEIHFCPRCGKPISTEDKFGKQRPVCKNCGWVFFSDPKVAVTALIRKEGKVLLVRRVNQPAQGAWTLPGGFMDAFEVPEKAVQRECLEETGLTIEVDGLHKMFSGREHEHGSDILLVYDAHIISGELRSGDDADRAEFFMLDALPPLAFHSTEKILHELSS